MIAEHSSDKPVDDFNADILLDDRASKRQKLDISEEVKPNGKLKEYLDVMKPRMNEKTWANETFDLASTSSSIPKDITFQESEDEDDIVELPGRLQSFQENLDDVDEMLDIPETTEDKAAQATMTDEEWFRARRKRIIEGSEVVTKQKEVDSTESKNKETIEIKEPIEPEESPTDIALKTITTTKRLFLRNISYSCREEELLEVFSRFGNVEEVCFCFIFACGSMYELL